MLVGVRGLMAETLPPAPDGFPGTTNGPEGPLVDETAPTVSGRPRCCLQAYAVKARSPRGRGWPDLRVPTAALGRWAFSAGGAWGKGRVFTRWFTRSSRALAVPLSTVRRRAGRRQAGGQAGGRALARASGCLSVRLGGCPSVCGQRGATPGEVEFHRRGPSAHRRSGSLVPEAQVSIARCAVATWRKVRPAL